MSRPYALLRAGYPYFRTIGEFMRMHFPADVAIHKDGRVFSFQTGSRYSKGKSGSIMVTDIEDKNYGSFAWRSDGTPLPHSWFLWPCQMVFDLKQEVLFCTDQADPRIQLFRIDDHYPEYLGRWGEGGSAPGQMKSPAGIACDMDNNIWIVDAGNHRVQKFTRDGKFLMQFGGFGTAEGQFDTPWGIYVDELGQVYVSDWRNDRVQVFNMDGRFQWQLGRPGAGNGEIKRPAGIHVDTDGDIYVADWGNNRVQLFTPDGRYVQQFHGDATLSKSQVARMYQRSGKQKRMREDADLEQEKYFTRPRSVRVDHRGYMFVPDYEHYRIQIYKKEAYPLDESQILPPFKVPTLNAN
ncbi:MAG: 6-bladed beta-propeller [SAR202 cluster bacterium]|nr:6-bladed beta-propeller [SAR202 cluster bacterium]